MSARIAKDPFEETCKANLIRCGYHGRRFDLEGQFLSMPNLKASKIFRQRGGQFTEGAACHLGKFLFVGIDPARLLKNFVPPPREGFQTAGSEKSDLYQAKTTRWMRIGPCMRKLSRRFPHSVVHRSLNEVSITAVIQRTFLDSSLQTARVGSQSATDIPTTRSRPHHCGALSFYFPNTMFNFIHGGSRLISFADLFVENDSEFHTYCSDETELDKGAGADLSRVELEDEAVCRKRAKRNAFAFLFSWALLSYARTRHASFSPLIADYWLILVLT